jgi:hypothetical protein
MMETISSCILEKRVDLLVSLLSISHAYTGTKFCICAWLLEEVNFSGTLLLMIFSKAIY